VGLAGCCGWRRGVPGGARAVHTVVGRSWAVGWDTLVGVCNLWRYVSDSGVSSVASECAGQLPLNREFSSCTSAMCDRPWYSDWDLRQMMRHQCKTLGMRVPSVFTRWINIKKVFMKVHEQRKQKVCGCLCNTRARTHVHTHMRARVQTRTRTRTRVPDMYVVILASMSSFSPFQQCCCCNVQGMAGMLNVRGMELVGRHHSGIDDCKNIAQLLAELLTMSFVDLTSR